jgi:hypothetical protein
LIRNVEYIFIRKRVVFAEQIRANPEYLAPNSDSLQKPVEGLSASALFSTKKHRGIGTRENDRSLPAQKFNLYKRGYSHRRATSLQAFCSKKDEPYSEPENSVEGVTTQAVPS